MFTLCVQWGYKTYSFSKLIQRPRSQFTASDGVLKCYFWVWNFFIRLVFFSPDYTISKLMKEYIYLHYLIYNACGPNGMLSRFRWGIWGTCALNFLFSNKYYYNQCFYQLGKSNAKCKHSALQRMRPVSMPSQFLTSFM